MYLYVTEKYEIVLSEFPGILTRSQALIVTT